MRVLAVILAAATLCGCITKVDAPTVRPWEGRYDSKEKAEKAVEQIDLKKGESVWILSSSTMKRLLKATKE